MNSDDTFQFANLNEDEMGAITGLHFAEDSVAKVRASIPANAAGLSHCEDCGEEIPAERRKAYPGVRQCVSCKSEQEFFLKMKARA